MVDQQKSHNNLALFSGCLFFLKKPLNQPSFYRTVANLESLISWIRVYFSHHSLFQFGSKKKISRNYSCLAFLAILLSIRIVNRVSHNHKNATAMPYMSNFIIFTIFYVLVIKYKYRSFFPFGKQSLVYNVK